MRCRHKGKWRSLPATAVGCAPCITNHLRRSDRSTEGDDRATFVATVVEITAPAACTGDSGRQACEGSDRGGHRLAPRRVVLPNPRAVSMG